MCTGVYRASLSLAKIGHGQDIHIPQVFKRDLRPFEPVYLASALKTISPREPSLTGGVISSDRYYGPPPVEKGIFGGS